MSAELFSGRPLLESSSSKPASSKNESSRASFLWTAVGVASWAACSALGQAGNCNVFGCFRTLTLLVKSQRHVWSLVWKASRLAGSQPAPLCKYVNQHLGRILFCSPCVAYVPWTSPYPQSCLLCKAPTLCAALPSATILSKSEPADECPVGWCWARKLWSQCPRYTVSVDRTLGQRLGLRVDKEDGELFILEVQPGLVQEWNEANPHSQAGHGAINLGIL